MSTRMKKKIDKWVIILGTGLVILLILPFIFANPALNKLNELEENVIEPHFNTFLDRFEILRIQVDRYEDTENTRTYEVILKEGYDVGNGTYSHHTVTYIIEIKDSEEVISTTHKIN